ncbi:MAG: ComEA family DNA-binding protein [Candidatus Methylomirabilales bacterium]
MTPRTLAPTDAAFAALLLLVLGLVALRGLLAVEEGDGFLVPSRPQARTHPVGQTVPSAVNFLVNPNRADALLLATLPGIGPVLAEAIVHFRQAHGPFHHLSDLQGVPGIGPKRLQKILPYLTLEDEAAWSTK